jgi:hypothetical protein
LNAIALANLGNYNAIADTHKKGAISIMPPKILSHKLDSIIVKQRVDDGYINLNQIAKASGKRLDNWIRLKETTSLLREFKESQDYQNLQPLVSTEGRNGGTWAHPDIAIQFAQWCNPSFALQVSRWVRAWMSQAASNAQWQQVRIEGKATRRSLTDAIADYIERHADELSENEKRWMYTNASQQVDLVVFGRIAKKLAEDLEVSRENLRDSFTSDELQLVREVENTAMRRIDRFDTHPIEAVATCSDRLAIPVQTRKATGQLPADPNG